MLRLTEGHPGSGGILRARASSFQVDEELAYSPTGQGDHTFLRIQKTGLTTPQAVRQIVEALCGSLSRSDHREIGFAGLKDKHAVATQWISIPARFMKAKPELDTEDLKILEAIPHERKIKRGHQRQNRFSILIEEVPDGGIEKAQAVLEVLLREGLPNYFGPQRFGALGNNAERGLAMLKGEMRPPRDRTVRNLLYAALQSSLFNQVLQTRLKDGSFNKALLGDLMKKHTGGMFEVTDVPAEQARVEAQEISPTGPMLGPKMRAPSADALALELAQQKAMGLDEISLKPMPAGTRRSLRICLSEDTRLIPQGKDAYQVQVSLPSGSYATVFLDELIKPEYGPFDRTRPPKPEQDQQ